jgi:hypothetical protein
MEGSGAKAGGLRTSQNAQILQNTQICTPQVSPLCEVRMVVSPQISIQGKSSLFLQGA